MSQMPYQSNVKSTYQADAFLKKILSNFFIFSFLLRWGGGGSGAIKTTWSRFQFVLGFYILLKGNNGFVAWKQDWNWSILFLSDVDSFWWTKIFLNFKIFFRLYKNVLKYICPAPYHIQIRKKNEEIINTLFSRHTPYLLFCCWSCIGLNSWLDLTQPYYSILLNEPWSKNDKKLMLDQLTTWSLNLLTFDS